MVVWHPVSEEPPKRVFADYAAIFVAVVRSPSGKRKVQAVHPVWGWDEEDTEWTEETAHFVGWADLAAYYFSGMDRHATLNVTHWAVSEFPDSPEEA